MNKEAILELWHQPNSHLHKAAIGMIAEGMPETFQLCIEMLHEGPHEQCGSLVAMLRSKMPFLRQGFDESRDVVEDHYDVFGNLADLYKSVMAVIRKIQDPQLLKTVYYHFDGIRLDLRRLFPNIDFPDSTNSKNVNDRQLMVFVTGICNLQCSYCFSNDIIRKHISPADIKRIFEWAYVNECKIVTPCGGEPLMYRHFGLFLELVAQYGMSTYFASNFTIPLSRFEPKQISAINVIMVHITESLWEHSEYMRIFCENAKTAQDRGIELIARVNITSPDMNVDPWFEIIDLLGIKSMNVALTIPSSAHNNTYIETSSFSDFVPILKKCINECKARCVNVSFAKPIPPCLFDESTAAWLLKFDNFTPLCSIYEDKGTKNLCLSPNLYFTPCLGISQPQIPFSKLLTWEELHKEFEVKVKSLLKKELSSKCGKCFLYARRLCQGACLSYKDFPKQ